MRSGNSKPGEFVWHVCHACAQVTLPDSVSHRHPGQHSPTAGALFSTTALSAGHEAVVPLCAISERPPASAREKKQKKFARKQVIIPDSIEDNVKQEGDTVFVRAKINGEDTWYYIMDGEWVVKEKGNVMFSTINKESLQEFYNKGCKYITNQEEEFEELEELPEEEPKEDITSPPSIPPEEPTEGGDTKCPTCGNKVKPSWFLCPGCKNPLS